MSSVSTRVSGVPDVPFDRIKFTRLGVTVLWCELRLVALVLPSIIVVLPAITISSTVNLWVAESKTNVLSSAKRSVTIWGTVNVPSITILPISHFSKFINLFKIFKSIQN